LRDGKQGESLVDIGRSYNVSHSTINRPSAEHRARPVWPEVAQPEAALPPNRIRRLARLMGPRGAIKAGGRRSPASLWRPRRVPAVECFTRRSSTCRTPTLEFEWPALSAAFIRRCRAVRQHLTSCQLFGSWGRLWARSIVALVTNNGARSLKGAVPLAGSCSFSRSHCVMTAYDCINENPTKFRR